MNVAVEKLYITKELLNKYGYEFNNRNEEEIFIKMVNDDFVSDLGKTITKKLKPDKIIELKKLLDDENSTHEEIASFLEGELPESELISKQVFNKHIRKLKRSKKRVEKEIRRKTNGIF